MKYELTFIISPAIAETDHPSVNQGILDYLKGIDAKVTREPYFMGRRKLTYPIAKQKHGFYVCLEFETDNTVVLKELDTKLKHNSSLLRYLVIRLENRTESAMLDFSKMEEREKPKTKNRPTRTSKMSTGKVRRNLESRERKDDNKNKVALEDIDKKLDEILAEPKVD